MWFPADEEEDLLFAGGRGASHAPANLRQVLAALGPKRLRDLTINVALFDCLERPASYHVLFGMPSVSRWKIFPAKLKLPSADPRRGVPTDIPFTHFQHVVHDMAHVISILTQKKGVATFQGKPHNDYHGPELWSSFS